MPGWHENTAKACKNYNRSEVDQKKSSWSYFKNTQTLQLFTVDIKQKLFTKDIRNAKQQSLGLGELGILQLKGRAFKGLEVRVGNWN
jgi:hypothetical protein